LHKGIFRRIDVINQLMELKRFAVGVGELGWAEEQPIDFKIGFPDPGLPSAKGLAAGSEAPSRW
jgi:hypothetical protein